MANGFFHESSIFTSFEIKFKSRLWKFLIIFICFTGILYSREKPDVTIDADTGNEVDDPYTLVRALLEPNWNIIAFEYGS